MVDILGSYQARSLPTEEHQGQREGDSSLIDIPQVQYELYEDICADPPWLFPMLVRSRVCLRIVQYIPSLHPPYLQAYHINVPKIGRR